jgi:asparagine synthase (glutamine-hydrolysing)
LQTPQREWLADDLKKWVEGCIEEIANSNHANWFNLSELQNELQLYLEGDLQSSFHIWQCISYYEFLKSVSHLI